MRVPHCKMLLYVYRDSCNIGYRIVIYCKIRSFILESQYVPVDSQSVLSK